VRGLLATARVAGHVAALHGEAALGELVHAGIDEAEVRLGLEVTQQVREMLRSERSYERADAESE
jgi:hypothetical protein